MPKLTKRTQVLTKPQQREFVSYHIPGRIQVIEVCFADRGQIPYGKLAAAAIFSRAIAAFLGLSTRNGRLHSDHTYFPHEPGRSWEVKLSDIDGGSCLTLQDLTTQERDALENGINETNRAFAHLTYLGRSCGSGFARTSYRRLPSRTGSKTAPLCGDSGCRFQTSCCRITQMMPNPYVVCQV
jgi:hypothetical protein